MNISFSLSANVTEVPSIFPHRQVSPADMHRSTGAQEQEQSPAVCPFVQMKSVVSGDVATLAMKCPTHLYFSFVTEGLERSILFCFKRQ